ncbi:MAG: hypothetical protein Q9227_002343 [Pyrenula ochraceoflavens]
MTEYQPRNARAIILPLENPNPGDQSQHMRLRVQQTQRILERLGQGTENWKEFQAIMTRPDPQLDFNGALDLQVELTKKHDAGDLAPGWRLWCGRGTKRLKGIAPHEPMDDRPSIYFQDPLVFGEECSRKRPEYEESRVGDKGREEEKKKQDSKL